MDNKLKSYYEQEQNLWETAVSRYLDKTDWNISDWFDEDEWKEYQEVRAKLGNPID